MTSYIKKISILSLSILMITVFSCKKNSIVEEEEFDLFPKEYQEQGEAFLKENMMLSDIINQNSYYTSKEVINYLEINNIILKYNTYENLKMLDKTEDEINMYISNCLENTKERINSLSKELKEIIEKCSQYIFNNDEVNLKNSLKNAINLDGNEQIIVYDYISKVYYNYLSSISTYPQNRNSRDMSLGCWWGVCIYKIDWCLGGFCWYTDLKWRKCRESDNPDKACDLSETNY